MSMNNNSGANVHSPGGSLLGMSNLNQILAINNEFPNSSSGDSTSNNNNFSSSGNSAIDTSNSNTKISAYARLDFDTFTFYIQTLEVVLGRRVQNDNSYTVDVNLGPKKAVSRKHAKIFYNFGSQKFEITVLGRNGLFVDNNFIEKGSTVTLADGNKIQIGPVIFNFVLPNNNNTNESDGLKKLNANRTAIGKLTSKKNSNTSKKVQKVKKEMKNNESSLLKSQPKDMVDKLTLITNLGDSDKGSSKSKTKNNKGELTSMGFSDSGLSSALDSKVINLDSALFKSTVSPIDEHSLNKLLEMTKTPTTPFLPLSPSVTNQIDTVLNSLDTKKLEATTGINTSNLNIPALNEVINPEKINSSTSLPPNNKRASQTANTSTVSSNKVTKPTKVSEKKGAKKDKPAKPKKQPKKVYTLEEIPEKYRTKPSTSYSNIIIHCLKTYCSENKGMSLSEIYKAIQDLYPYYKYCPDGWQSSVRHNLSLNKAFRKISKEGKGWLWGLDEEYFVEKDKVKKKPQNADVSKSPGTSTALPKAQSNTRATPNQKNVSNSISAAPKVLNASKAAVSKPKLTAEDKQILNILQEQLKAITKNIKGLSKEDVIKLLTAALSSTMSQLQKSSAGQSILKYVQTNPDILTKILTSSLNGATLKVTNGKWNFSDLISGKVKQPVSQNKPKSLNSIPLIPLKPVVKNKATVNTHSNSKLPAGRISKPSNASANNIIKPGVVANSSTKVSPKSLNKMSPTAVTKDKVSTVIAATSSKKQSPSANNVSKQVDVSAKPSNQDKKRIKKDSENDTSTITKKESIGDYNTKAKEKQGTPQEALNGTTTKTSFETIPADVEMKESEPTENNDNKISEMKAHSEEEVTSNSTENDDDDEKVTAESVLEKVKNRSASFVALERNLDKLINSTSTESSDKILNTVPETSDSQKPSDQLPIKKTESISSFSAGETTSQSTEVSDDNFIKKLHTTDDKPVNDSNTDSHIKISSKIAGEVNLDNGESVAAEAAEDCKAKINDSVPNAMNSTNNIKLDEPVAKIPRVSEGENIDSTKPLVKTDAGINQPEDNTLSAKKVLEMKLPGNEDTVMTEDNDKVSVKEENLKDCRDIVGSVEEKVEEKKGLSSSFTDSMQNQISNASVEDKHAFENASRSTGEVKNEKLDEATSVSQIVEPKESNDGTVADIVNSRKNMDELSGQEDKAQERSLKKENEENLNTNSIMSEADSVNNIPAKDAET